MFEFGSVEDRARLYMDVAHTVRGPYDDPNRSDPEALAISLAYCRIACETAVAEAVNDDVIDYLVNKHDEIFKALCWADRGFRNTVLNTNKIQWLGGHEPENIAKYRRFAKEASAN